MEVIANFINVNTMLFCIVIGYLWTATVPESSKSRRWIPITMAAIGVIVAVIVIRPISLEVILTGMISGLASTGCYESFKQLVLKPKWIKEERNDSDDNAS